MPVYCGAQPEPQEDGGDRREDEDHHVSILDEDRRYVAQVALARLGEAATIRWPAPQDYPIDQQP